jgi:hypothetical protein
MSISARVLAFGVVSGLVWSAMPGLLTGLFFNSVSETLTVLLAAVVTGAVISFALKQVLARTGFWGCFGLGLLSLPVGAFTFGILASLVEILTGDFSITNDFGGSPFMVGYFYALYSVISVLVVVFIPLAILTTFLLRRVVVSNRKIAD